MRAMVAVLVAMVGVGCLRWPGPTGSPRVMKLVGGEKGYELLAIPALARVEVYRAAGADGVEIGDARWGEGPLKLGDAERVRLSHRLREEGTYEEGAGTAAVFRPDAAVRFVGAKRTVDFVFSFSTREVRTYEGGRGLGAALLSPVGEELKTMLDAAIPK